MFKIYVRNVSGNMAAIFAVSLLMLMTVIGAAVDYNSMIDKKFTYQSLADIAVLAAAKSGEEKIPELKEIALAAIEANNFSEDIVTTELSLTDQGRIQVKVSGAYDAVIMSLFGRSQKSISAIAEAPLAVNEPVDIALVLDTTGSMSGSKINSLKAAANTLVTLLENYENDSIRVSVVPFSEYVNVGLSRRYEPWLNVPADSTTPLAEKCYMRRDIISKTNCKTTTHARTCYNDGIAYSCPWTSTTCDYIYGPTYEHCYTPTRTRRWYGCVGSRQAPWNERAYKGAVPIPGLMNERDCAKEILPLTNNMSVVRAKINSLTAADETYLPAGLMWGWRTLQPEAPLIEASTTQTNNKSTVLIFMTDGANTVSQNGERHNGRDVAHANNTTQKLCSNIKNDRIKIYTVIYDFDGVDTLDILRECATSSDMSFLASDAAGLIQAFEDIGTNLLELRLTQ